MTVDNVPAGYATVNPFVITRGVEGLMGFVAEVFGGVEVPEAHTMDHDGLLLHAELQVGGTRIMFVERKPGWPFTPSLLQVYVDDVAQTLARAEALGAEVVTRPTPFYGEVFSRIIDPWQNLWWVYSALPDGGKDGASDSSEEEWAVSDGEGDGGEESAGDWQPTPDLTYIHDTIIEAFPRIRDPHPR